MTNDLEIRLHRAVLKYDVTATKTVPSIGLDDKRFVYVPAIKTNLSETFKRAYEAIGVRRVEKAA